MRGRESVFPNQRDELIRCDQKGDGVNKAEQPENNKTRQPIRISAGQEIANEFFISHHQPKSPQAGLLLVNRLRLGTVDQLLKSRILAQRIPMPAQPKVRLSNSQIEI